MRHERRFDENVRRVDEHVLHVAQLFLQNGQGVGDDSHLLVGFCAFVRFGQKDGNIKARWIVWLGRGDAAFMLLDSHLESEMQNEQQRNAPATYSLEANCVF